MSKTAQAYGLGQALIPVLPPPQPFETAPTSSQTNYDIGQIAYTPPRNPTAFYIYAGGGSWLQAAPSLGTLLAFNGTANQIVATRVLDTITLSLPLSITTPGSLTATTSLTSGTGITSTAGNITASNGNLVSSSPGKGLSLNASSNTGLAIAPVVVNARAGQAVFTSVSVPPSTDLTLRISNSSIIGPATQVIYSMSGASTGSALSIKSVTNTPGSSAIVVTNAAGSATSTSNITLNFLVVN